ncbi:MAG: transposase [Holdemanella porci]|jgi:transposase
MNWIRELEMSEIQRETLNEYIAEMENLNDKINRFMNRIDEMYQSERYHEKVSKLRCFKGIETFAAMTIQVETADFERFPSAKAYASYTGLTTGEHSSGDKNNRIGITKQGNTVIRKTLVECAQSLVKGNVYAKKSQGLKSRQKGMDVNIIAYADKATERLKKKYQKLIERNVPRNKAIVAVARELACFIWGMETGNIH